MTKGGYSDQIDNLEELIAQIEAHGLSSVDFYLDGAIDLEPLFLTDVRFEDGRIVAKLSR